MTQYAWMLSQVPTIIAHLRDSMLPIAATQYDRTRVDGTREQPLPFRTEPMDDADALWGYLVAYGREIARYIHPAPHAITGTAAHRIRATAQWHEAGDAAHTVTAWLIHHEHRIAELNLDVAGFDLDLFATIGRLLARYRITPNRLRTVATRCVLCGEHAVRAEWAWNRAGYIAETVQCTVCGRRYDPGEVVRSAADLQGSGEAGAAQRAHHQTVAP